MIQTCRILFCLGLPTRVLTRNLDGRHLGLFCEAHYLGFAHLTAQDRHWDVLPSRPTDPRLGDWMDPQAYPRVDAPCGDCGDKADGIIVNTSLRPVTAIAYRCHACLSPIVPGQFHLNKDWLWREFEVIKPPVLVIPNGASPQPSSRYTPKPVVACSSATAQCGPAIGEFTWPKGNKKAARCQRCYDNMATKHVVGIAWTAF